MRVDLHEIWLENHPFGAFNLDPKLSSTKLVHGEESNGDLRGLSIFRHPYLELFIGDPGHFFSPQLTKVDGLCGLSQTSLKYLVGGLEHGCYFP